MSRNLRSGVPVGQQLALLVDVTPAAEPAVADILTERLRQVALWGGPDADDKRDADQWLALTGGYLGKAHEASIAVHDATVYGADPEQQNAAVAEYRRRLVQVAALATAAVESLDRLIAHESLTDKE
jgi:hypothetical protein